MMEEGRFPTAKAVGHSLCYCRQVAADSFPGTEGRESPAADPTEEGLWVKRRGAPCVDHTQRYCEKARASNGWGHKPLDDP